MLYPPGFYYVKKPKRFVILSSDKSSERNLSSSFDIKNPRRIEHLQSKEPFSSDPYFSTYLHIVGIWIQKSSFIKCVHTYFYFKSTLNKPVHTLRFNMTQLDMSRQIKFFLWESRKKYFDLRTHWSGPYQYLMQPP